MTVWVALLRAVNVGGTGKIEMARLRAAVNAAGLSEVRTYIASGNLVFRGPDNASDTMAMLRNAIASEFGESPDLILRSADQIIDIIARNPFPSAPGNRVLVLFSEDAMLADGARNAREEEIVESGRELFVHYPSGIGVSKLSIPASRSATGRNINTVRKLGAMTAQTA